MQQYHSLGAGSSKWDGRMTIVAVVHSDDCCAFFCVCGRERGAMEIGLSVFFAVYARALVHTALGAI